MRSDETPAAADLTEVLWNCGRVQIVSSEDMCQEERTSPNRPLRDDKLAAVDADTRVFQVRSASLGLTAGVGQALVSVRIRIDWETCPVRFLQIAIATKITSCRTTSRLAGRPV